MHCCKKSEAEPATGRIVSHHIETTVAGRILVSRPERKGPLPLLMGFHGYGRSAEDELALLESLPGGSSWLRCAVEALHPFYTGGGTCGASWMTSRERERMIQDNIRYVDAVLSDLETAYPLGDTLVYHGFSQGAPMACRAALCCSRRPSGVMLLGGDIPPECSGLDRMGRVHIARGDSDRLYPREVFERDVKRLHDEAVPFLQCNFHGDHEAAPEYFVSAGGFLARFAVT
ncbi:phospholipase [Prosthecochloris sp. GSB1]|uniref:alpha/beta hydrolase n=1 Tax=Prosthecochloris sp. GSB1 TaxID=281093 RepID=UPI000B8CD760|nr:phospholipase [Prosthecochloris sp. GSB1]ASQ89697.1 phospholipase [Prosthecochloris sp. GSB1]